MSKKSITNCICTFDNREWLPTVISAIWISEHDRIVVVKSVKWPRVRTDFFHSRLGKIVPHVVLLKLSKLELKSVSESKPVSLECCIFENIPRWSSGFFPSRLRPWSLSQSKYAWEHLLPNVLFFDHFFWPETSFHSNDIFATFFCQRIAIPWIAIFSGS